MAGKEFECDEVEVASWRDQIRHFRPQLRRWPNLVGASAYMLAGLSKLAAIADAVDEEEVQNIKFHIRDQGGKGKAKSKSNSSKLKAEMSDTNDSDESVLNWQHYKPEPEIELENYILNAPWKHSMSTAYSGCIDLTEKYVIFN